MFVLLVFIRIFMDRFPLHDDFCKISYSNISYYV